MSKALTRDWQNWLHINHCRGCAHDELLHQLAIHQFDLDEARYLLSLWVADQESAQLSMWSQAVPDSLRQFKQARKVDTDLAELYHIHGFLSEEECGRLVNAIDKDLVPSSVTYGSNIYRTSQTCHLQTLAPELIQGLEDKFSQLLGVDPSLSEPVQGQRYDPGQYFKAHTDWFDPAAAEFSQHARIGGQRTWTVMVYLNSVEKGGETIFHHLGATFSPQAGAALAWNNLNPDGSPNHATLHEALPVESGCKYVITKWFRMFRGR